MGWNPENSRFLKVPHRFFAGGFAELAPRCAIATGRELPQLLGGLDEDGADPARLQRSVDGQLPERSRAWGRLVVNPAKRHRQARRWADSEIVDLAAPGTLKGLAELGEVPGRPGPGARWQVLAGQVADRQRDDDLHHNHHLLLLAATACAGIDVRWPMANGQLGRHVPAHRVLLIG